MTAFIRWFAAGVLIGMLSIFSASAQDEPNKFTSPHPNSTTAKPVQEGPNQGPPSTATTVAASDPVITIHGLCDDQSIQSVASVKSCTTTVTRESFEKLLNSMNVVGKTLTPEIRRNLAETYAQYLALERPAIKAGLANSPRFADIMRWWRLRTLADLYLGSLLEEFKNPTREDVHTYYVDHLSSYQRIKAFRILIPRTPGDTELAKQSDKKALEIANAARERISEGENSDVVQKDSYSALGITSPPPTDLGTHPRSSFPAEETDELFALAPGQISKVEIEGASYVIYKIISSETVPEDLVKDEMSAQITQNKYDEAIRSAKDLTKSELNQAYFGPPAASTPAHANTLSGPHP